MEMYQWNLEKNLWVQGIVGSAITITTESLKNQQFLLCHLNHHHIPPQTTITHSHPPWHKPKTFQSRTRFRTLRDLHVRFPLSEVYWGVIKNRRLSSGRAIKTVGGDHLTSRAFHVAPRRFSIMKQSWWWRRQKEKKATKNTPKAHGETAAQRSEPETGSSGAARCWN